jgi:membrane protease YdiL (CAAX protease family)
MDTPPPDDFNPLQAPILLPASDLPPLTESTDEVVILQPAGPPSSPLMSRRQIRFAATLAVGAVLYCLLLIKGGAAGRFAAEGMQVLPFLGLTLLAYAGEWSAVGRIITVVYWGVLILTAALFIALFTGGAELDVPALTEMARSAKEGKPSRDLSRLFLPGGLMQSALTALTCFAFFLAGAGAYLPKVRRVAARWIPGFRAASFIHAVALATVGSLTLMLFAPLVVTGNPPLLALIRHFSQADFGEGGVDFASLMADQNVLLEQVYSFVWLAPMCVVAVGWPVHRTLPVALRRVGFVVPKLWQVLFGLGLAVVLAIVMTFADIGIGYVWDLMHWPRTDEKAVEQLFKSMTSVTGAIVIGVTAGVGEELFARGVLQPRLGILLSNLFFTSLHALQYSWDGLLSVFIIGLVLGLVRKKTNTTTSAIVHGTYDFLLVLASVYQIDPTKWFGG